MNGPFFHVRRKVRLLGMVRQIPRRLLPQKIKALIREYILPLALKNPIETIKTRAQAQIDEKQGLAAGNLHFWTSLSNRDWSDVQTRLFTLAAVDDGALVEDFLGKGLSNGLVPSFLPLLARSGIASATLTTVLRTSIQGDKTYLFQQIARSRQFTVNLAAVAQYLLEPDEADQIMGLISQAYPILPPAYHSTLDSLVITPNAKASSLRGTVAVGPTRKPAQHRLVIVDELKDPQRLSLLFDRAEKVTVYSPSDLYGKLDFSVPDLHYRPKEITVAHPRSRITRFSAKYQDLHTETWQIAEEMVADLEREGEGFFGAAAPYFALHLADKLFFSTLAIAAFEDFVTAEDYDQIVIASTGQRQSESFFKSLASGIDLTSDPRIEFTCLSTAPQFRTAFSKHASSALWPKDMGVVQAPAVDAVTRPLSEIIEETGIAARPESKKMRIFPSTQSQSALSRPGDPAALRDARVLYVTTQAGAYNSSSTQFLDILSRHFNTLTAFVGINTTAFFKALPDGILPPSSGSVQLLSTAATAEHVRLGDYLTNFVAKTRARLLRDGRSCLTAHVLDVKADEIVGSTLKGGYLHWITLLHWFKRLEESNTPPELVVLSPMRPALVGMAAAAARHYGIPSLSLEPHGLNQSYCRYAKVATDKYGVISEFFREEAARGFGISIDRVAIIGSPRLRAPADYDVQERLAAARASIEAKTSVTFDPEHTVIAFFAQPSNWEQISAVWSIILDAVKDLPNVRLLLQPHPEEGPMRLTGYQAIAESMGMTDRVDTIKAGAIEVIEAADLVLSCYSATVLEAALYRKPVFCVKDGPGDYPLNQNEVVNAPMFRDSDSLRREIAIFIAAPTKFQKRAHAFLEREPQFIEGPEPRLVHLVETMLSCPAAETIRPAEDLPSRLLIEGPHQVFNV